MVDAFTDKVFHGNQAAVCIMEQWLPDTTMLRIACENNVSETAFAVPEGAQYRLRWFTPGGEIDLCGHATLATAYVLMTQVRPELQQVSFLTLSGVLTVVRQGDFLEMDFPAYSLTQVEVTSAMIEALGTVPLAAFLGRDLLCVCAEESTVRQLTPDLEKVKALDGLLLHVTARGKEYDCVSRSFAPKLNVAEDPVCGSGHCHIIPYWAAITGRRTLTAYQASPRGGTLYCTQEGQRVRMGGKAVLYAIAELFV